MNQIPNYIKNKKSILNQMATPIQMRFLPKFCKM